MAKTGYEDQHGCTWETCWTGGTLDENACDECAENVSETLVCMDGGEAYCWACLKKVFDVEYAEDRPKAVHARGRVVRPALCRVAQERCPAVRKEAVMTSESKSLAPFIVGLQAAEPIGHLNLTLIPVIGDGNEGMDYVLGADAIRDGALMITEVGPGGRVPELLVTSTTEQMVLLLDGEELVGAKQNRILNTSVLLPPRARTRIPVSCVERGRWHRVSARFAPGHYSPARLRSSTCRHVGRNLRAFGRATSDQAAVWNTVSHVLGETGTLSSTSAMHDAYQTRNSALKGYVNALPCPEGARGVLVAIDGRFEAMDLLGKADTMKIIWPRLVTAYALDALARQKGRSEAFTPERASAVLGDLAGVPCQPCPSAGVGEDWRFESESLVGHALVVDDQCVHLSAFRAD